MTKVVINQCYGGFGISKECAAYCGIAWTDHYGGIATEEVARTNPKLIEFIEKFGSNAASGQFAELAIATIPDDVEWQIGEYDGMEHVAEQHRTWYGGISE